MSGVCNMIRSMDAVLGSGSDIGIVGARQSTPVLRAGQAGIIPGNPSASSPGFSLNLQVRNIGLRADKGRSVVSDANFSLNGFSVSPHFKTGPGTGPKWLNHFWNRTRPNQSGTARSSG